QTKIATSDASAPIVVAIKSSNSLPRSPGRTHDSTSDSSIFMTFSALCDCAICAQHIMFAADNRQHRMAAGGSRQSAMPEYAGHLLLPPFAAACHHAAPFAGEDLSIDAGAPLTFHCRCGHLADTKPRSPAASPQPHGMTRLFTAWSSRSPEKQSRSRHC